MRRLATVLPEAKLASVALIDSVADGLPERSGSPRTAAVLPVAVTAATRRAASTPGAVIVACFDSRSTSTSSTPDTSRNARSTVAVQ